MFCGEWSLVKRHGNGATVLPLKCKCWTCDECRPMRTKRLVEEAKRGKPNTFVTLTSRRRRGLTRDEAAVAIVRAFRILRREYIREHGKGSFPFLAVFEETKRGWPHVHMVCRTKWISRKWLKKRMGELTDSPVVHVRRVKGLRKVASYITKYISKNPHRFAGVKRYWRSLDYLLPPAEDDDDPWLEVPVWHIVQRFWEFVAEDLQAAGWRVNEAPRRLPP